MITCATQRVRADYVRAGEGLKRPAADLGEELKVLVAQPITQGAARRILAARAAMGKEDAKP